MYEPQSSFNERTCEADALVEVHALHALGKHELVDGACGKEGEEREKNKVRKEDTSAADPQETLFKKFSSGNLLFPLRLTLCLTNGALSTTGRQHIILCRLTLRLVTPHVPFKSLFPPKSST